MNYVKGQFVVLPYVYKLDELKIKYTDLLIYVALRSFDGVDGCFPSYETIAAKAKCCRDFVIKAIKRLENAELIFVKHSKQRDVSNRYKFANTKRFEQIPYQIFRVELTTCEKSMLLCMRQVVNTVGTARTDKTVKKIAEFLGLTYQQVYKPLTSLIDKGYVELGRNRMGKYYQFTDKISWNMDYKKTKTPSPTYPKLVVR